MLAIVARRSGSLADGCVSCNWRGVDQDASRMSVEVGVMVGDLVSSLVVVRYDVLKWVCVPTLEVAEVAVTDVNVCSL